MSRISKVISRTFKTYEEAETWLQNMSSGYLESQYQYMRHEIHEERTGYLNMYHSGTPNFQYKAIFRYE